MQTFKTVAGHLYFLDFFFSKSLYLVSQWCFNKQAKTFIYVYKPIVLVLLDIMVKSKKFIIMNKSSSAANKLKNKKSLIFLLKYSVSHHQSLHTDVFIAVTN